MGRTNNTEVCRKFVQGEPAQGNNLLSTGTTLISYSTPIAWFKPGPPIVIEVTTRRYSVTTSCHLGRCKNAAARVGRRIVDVDR